MNVMSRHVMSSRSDGYDEIHQAYASILKFIMRLLSVQAGRHAREPGTTLSTFPPPCPTFSPGKWKVYIFSPWALKRFRHVTTAQKHTFLISQCHNTSFFPLAICTDSIVLYHRYACCIHSSAYTIYYKLYKSTPLFLVYQELKINKGTSTFPPRNKQSQTTTCVIALTTQAMHVTRYQRPLVFADSHIIYPSVQQ